MRTRSILLVALVALVSGCVENGGTLQWASICAPPSDASSCTFSSTCDAQYIGEYVLDAPGELWLTVQVNNQRANNADPAYGQVNTADAYIEQYEVTFDGPLAVPTAIKNVEYMVPANGTAVVSVFVPVSVTPAAATTIFAHVMARGKYVDQSTFETASFSIPILICSGCVGVPACPVATPSLTATCPPTVAQVPLSYKCE
jgi:hypothetical protein